MLRRVIDRYVRVVDLLSLAGGYAAGIACLLILILVCVEVALRSLFASSTQMSDEFSGYLNVAVIYLGLSYTLREGGFIRVDIVYQKLRGPIGQVVKVLIVAASLAYILIILYYMTGHVRENYETGMRAFSVLETPVWMPQTLVLAGSVLLVLQLTAYLLKGARDVP